MLEFAQNQPARIPVRMLSPVGQPVPGIVAGAVSVTIEKANGTTVNLTIDGVVNTWTEVVTGAFANQAKYDLVLDASNLDVLGPLVLSVISPGGSAMGLVHVTTPNTLTPSQVAAAVWDEPLASHVAVGSIGAAIGSINQVPSNVENFQPAAGTPISSDSTISFDNDSSRRILITATNGTSTGADLVFDGTAFRYPYATGSSRIANNIGGFKYSIKRDGGWRVTPTIEVFDTSGNEVP